MEEREAYLLSYGEYKDEVTRVRRQFEAAGELNGNARHAALAEIFTQRTTYDDTLLRNRRMGGRVGLTNGQFCDLVEAGDLARSCDAEMAAIIIKMFEAVLKH